MSNIFYQIQHDFLAKIAEITKIRALVSLMKKEKNLLLKNVFIEKNFKLPQTVDQQDEAERKLLEIIELKFEKLEEQEVRKERERTKEFEELKKLLA